MADLSNPDTPDRPPADADGDPGSTNRPEDRSADPREAAEPRRLENPEGDDDGLNWRIVVGVVASAAILGFLVVDGLGSETYFYTVDEATAQQSSLVGDTIRVKGTVVEGSVDNYDDRVGRSFEISEKGESIRVTYDQATPDTFDEGVQVVATGRLSKSGTLEADEVLVKCPSRYGEEPPTAKEDDDGPQASR